jgi:hypothetical protein
MKVLLAVGAPYSSHERVIDLFDGLGLKEPLPSRYEAQTPQVLQGLILGGHEVDLAKPGPLQAIKPGRLWSEMAVNLFMANINQPMWGWADHQTGLLLDFWADFDPQVRFVICYESPNAYLASALADVPEPDVATIDRALNDWSRWNVFLLAQFERHRDRCLLVNSHEALRDPQRLLDAAGSAWQWPVESACYPVDPSAVDVLAHHVARGFMPADHVAWALAEKLDGQAHVAGSKQADSLEHAWADWTQMRQRLGEAVRIVPIEAAKYQLEKQVAGLMETAVQYELVTQQLADAVAEKQLLADQLKQNQTKAASAEVEQLSAQISKLASRIEQESRDNVRAAELVLENDHLMVALHQVQEELETQVMQAAELELLKPAAAEAVDSFAAKFWELHPPRELAVDMRRDIEGENWYGPEPDGRWAGPALHSWVRLPALEPGAYALELALADAIAPDIVYGLQIEAFGTDVPFEFSHAATPESFPIVCRAVLQVPQEAGAEPWNLSFRFPRTVSPADNGSPDERQLAIRLSSLQLRRADTAEQADVV